MPAPKNKADSVAVSDETPTDPVETQPQGTPADPTPAEPAPPEWGNWRYEPIDGTPRIYTHIPVTTHPGDVIEHPGVPADDGHWQPTDEPATRLPDNHPDTIAANHAAIEAAPNTPEEG